MPPFPYLVIAVVVYCLRTQLLHHATGASQPSSESSHGRPGKHLLGGVSAKFQTITCGHFVNLNLKKFESCHQSLSHYHKLLLTQQFIVILYLLQAVALQCRFLRLGAPIGFTSSTALSRLLCIREELVARKLHEPAKAHLFTCVSLLEESEAK